MGGMKFVPPLTETDRTALEVEYRQGATHRQRQRAQAVLLSARGYPLDQLADILAADRDTVSRWLDQWQKQGLAGLTDAPKPGRPSKLEAAVEEEILDLLEHPTPDLKALVQARLQKKG